MSPHTLQRWNILTTIGEVTMPVLERRFSMSLAVVHNMDLHRQQAYRMRTPGTLLIRLPH